MPDQLIRDVPEEVRSWIETERRARNKSQREFLLDILERARERDAAERLPLFATIPKIETPSPVARGFKFVDLFAGIGGIRIAFERAGGTCVFSSEWDKYSQKTYREWFGETPAGDIRKINPADIPDHDILGAGFPCQPFSIAGVSKKKSLGHAHGFRCVNQGNLFFTLANIIEEKEPPVIFLENVKNLKSHDNGRTWQVIQSHLEELGYRLFPYVIDAAGWVPQHRERIYIVGFLKKIFGENPPFKPPEPPAERPRFRDILESNPDPKYTLTDHLWNYLQEYARKHREKGNGFGYGLVDVDGVSRTLSARYFKDGSEILIPQPGKNPRRLTPRECLRLMGFPEELRVVVSDTQAYKQFGNAVVPKVVEAVAQKIVDVIAWQLTRTKNGCLLKRGTNGVARMRKSH